MTDGTPALQLSKGLRLMLALACFVVVVAGMRAASNILVPFLLATFIAIISLPPLAWMRKRGLPTPLAVILIVGAIVAAFVLITMMLGNSLNRFIGALPAYERQLRQLTIDIALWLERYGAAVSIDQVQEYLNLGTAMKMAANTLLGLSGVFTNLFLILLTVVFILLEAAGFTDKIRAATTDPESSLRQVSSIRETVNRYLAIKTLISLVTGLLIWLWCRILGLDYAELWGLLAFLLNFIPNIGSILAAVPAVLLAIVQLGPGRAAAVAAGYLVINVAIGNITEPRIMGRGLGLSTLVVFLSLVFWGWVLGPVGMLLSAPLTMILRIVLENTEETKGLAVMLGPALRKGKSG